MVSVMVCGKPLLVLGLFGSEGNSPYSLLFCGDNRSLLYSQVITRSNSFIFQAVAGALGGLTISLVLTPHLHLHRG